MLTAYVLSNFWVETTFNPPLDEKLVPPLNICRTFSTLHNLFVRTNLFSVLNYFYKNKFGHCEQYKKMSVVCLIFNSVIHWTIKRLFRIQPLSVMIQYTLFNYTNILAKHFTRIQSSLSVIVYLYHHILTWLFKYINKYFNR